MKRIIIKHLSGSRAGQAQEFPLDQFKQLTVGRDPASSVKYDPDGDDLVSRNHAVIAADAADPDYFTITDLGSTNGTFVNNQRLSAPMRLRPGDVVTFGPGGSSFEFDLDPRPQSAPRTTRHAATAPPAKTREAQVGGAAAGASSSASSSSASSAPSGSASASPPPPSASWSGFDTSSSSGAAGGAESGSVSASPRGSFGGGGARPPSRETVERLVHGARRETRRQMVIGGTAGVLAIVLVVGALFYLTRGKEPVVVSGAGVSPTPTATPLPIAVEIMAKYRAAVVRINAKWSLLEAASRKQVYLAAELREGGCTLLYERSRDGKPAPVLVTERPTCPGDWAVSGEVVGSGFVVSEDGTVMTNLHIAAAWNMPVELRAGRLRETDEPVAGQTWVPAQHEKNVPGFKKEYIGQNDYLEVRFAGKDIAHNAELTVESNDADVALIKINPPGTPLTRVNLLPENQLSEIQPGQNIVVLGYPAGSALTAIFRHGAPQGGQFGPGERPTLSAEPDVVNGNLSNVKVNLGSRKPDQPQVFRFIGDLYQHTAPVNPGSSGGPLFDQKGYVIGIVNAGIPRMDLTSFAVPISHGLKLMNSTRSPAQ